MPETNQDLLMEQINELRLTIPELGIINLQSIQTHFGSGLINS